MILIKTLFWKGMWRWWSEFTMPGWMTLAVTLVPVRGLKKYKFSKISIIYLTTHLFGTFTPILLLTLCHLMLTYNIPSRLHLPFLNDSTGHSFLCYLANKLNKMKIVYGFSEHVSKRLNLGFIFSYFTYALTRIYAPRPSTVDIN